MTVEEVRFNRFRVWHFIGYLIPFISQISGASPCLDGRKKRKKGKFLVVYLICSPLVKKLIDFSWKNCILTKKKPLTQGKTVHSHGIPLFLPHRSNKIEIITTEAVNQRKMPMFFYS